MYSGQPNSKKNYYYKYVLIKIIQEVIQNHDIMLRHDDSPKGKAKHLINFY